MLSVQDTVLDCVVPLFVHAKWRLLTNARIPTFSTLNYKLAQRDTAIT
jgi:hypothetical protein